MQNLINSELGIDTKEDLQTLKTKLLSILDDAKQGNTPMTDDEYFRPVGLIAHSIKIFSLMEQGKDQEAIKLTEEMGIQMDKLDDMYYNDQI